MKYAARNILLMKYKKQALEKEAKKRKAEIPNYFTKSDEQAIMKWGESYNEKIWKRIERNIIKDYGCYNLTSNTCPFCIRKTYQNDADCDICSYGKRHGVCSFYSTYEAILDVFYSISMVSFAEYDKESKENPVISNEKYKKILEKVIKLSGKYAKTLKNKYKTG